MPLLEIWLCALLVVCVVAGGWAILMTRANRGEYGMAWGRGLFVGTLFVLGGCTMVAAFHRAESLVPLGLVTGVLVVGMLWESPAWSRTDP
jgi:hypothetical protein